MHEPIALERAFAVLQHAKKLGGRLSQFTVSLTNQEGFELIDWFRAQADDGTANLALLDTDIALARSTDNPFLVLQHYELFGLKLSRRLH